MKTATTPRTVLVICPDCDSELDSSSAHQLTCACGRYQVHAGVVTRLPVTPTPPPPDRSEVAP